MEDRIGPLAQCHLRRGEGWMTLFRALGVGAFCVFFWGGEEGVLCFVCVCLFVCLSVGLFVGLFVFLGLIGWFVGWLSWLAIVAGFSRIVLARFVA